MKEALKEINKWKWVDFMKKYFKINEIDNVVVALKDLIEDYIANPTLYNNSIKSVIIGLCKEREIKIPAKNIWIILINII